MRSICIKRHIPPGVPPVTVSSQSLSLRLWVCHPTTRSIRGLLGPCFKTGHIKALRQRPKRKGEASHELPPNDQASEENLTIGRQARKVPKDPLLASVSAKVFYQEL